MVKSYYDRYNRFRQGTQIPSSNIPYIKIPETSTWKFDYYTLGFTRLDVLAEKYYADPNLGWLILSQNRDVFNGGIEFSPINDKIVIKIPFPKDESLAAFSKACDNFRKLYGE